RRRARRAGAPPARGSRRWRCSAPHRRAPRPPTASSRARSCASWSRSTPPIRSATRRARRGPWRGGSSRPGFRRATCACSSGPMRRTAISWRATGGAARRDGPSWAWRTSTSCPRAAILVADFIRLKRAGFVPARDLILVLTGDEETAGSCIAWLLARHRDLIDAEFALNTDAGGGVLRDGRPVTFEIQASEKVYATYVLEATDRGGHSSLPRPGDNPIYRVAAALGRIAAYQFPVRLNPVSRAYFERSAAVEPEPLASDLRGVLADPPDSGAVARLAAIPFYNAKLRTTCTATLFAAGHAENALPQSARATVNCRILPDQPPDEVAATLRRLAADERIALRTAYAPVPSPPSPLTPAVLGPIERLVAELFPGVAVIPVMEAGATDGLFLRNAGIPTYGVSAI